MLLLLFVAVVVALLPTIVAKTPLRNTLIAAAVPSGTVSVTVADASLGWFTAPSLGGVEVRDAAGQPLVTVESIRLNRAPLALVANSHDLGEIEIVRPTVYLAMRPDGTNLEDAIAAFMKLQTPKPPGATTASGSAPVVVSVKVVEGSVLAQDVTTGQRWRVHTVNAQFNTDALGGIGQLSVSGQMDDGLNSAAGTIPPGKFSFSLNPGPEGRQHAAVAGGDDFARGGGPDVAATGERHPAQRHAFGARHGVVECVAEQSAIRRAELFRKASRPPARCGSTNSTRRRRCSRAIAFDWRASRCRGKSRRSRAQLVIDECDVRSDLGRIATRGTIDPAVFAAPMATADALFDAVGRNNVQLRAEVDLARLATMLPHLLRIRDDTTITSGTLQLAVRNQPVDDGQAITGMAQAMNLAAMSAGRPLKLDELVSATFELRRQNGAVRLESLRCDSEFLTVNAAGTAQQLTADAKFDLNRLGTQLGQFVDLSGTELAGTGTGHLDWRQDRPSNSRRRRTPTCRNCA